MTVDRNWIDHIDAMDQLRKGISLRAYGQVDPVISYKKEGFDMFEEMVARIQRSVISVLLKVKVEMRPAPTAQPMHVRRMPAVPGAPTQAPVAPANVAPAAAPAPIRFRRQMPEPLSNMSSFKAAQEAQAAQKAEQDKKENE
ncbi:MAG: hypothetical protein IJ373_05205 [Clostridia bacterium]|nr:hypothetical protein [Clostridia bacterium]